MIIERSTPIPLCPLGVTAGKLKELVDSWTVIPGPAAKTYRVRLRLNIHADHAPRPCCNLVIAVPARWDRVLPVVWTDDAWAYRSINWHSQPKGRCDLCWVLPHEWIQWIDFWKLEGKSNREIAELAGDWLVTACELLMRRHYLGRTLGLAQWPEAWPAHEHFGKGVGQFLISNSIPYRLYRKDFSP